MAQRDGYRARAAYKLKEIDEQDKLIKPGQIVVDLGASPGSWSQYVRNRLGTSRQGAVQAGARTESGAETSESTKDGLPLAPENREIAAVNGTIVALDMLPMEPISGVQFIQGDFREDDVMAALENLLGGAKVDLVLSDMAPNLSGVASADAARIEHVCDLALEFSQKHLKPDGALLVKCFHGSGYSQIIEKFKHQFKVVAPRKPKASRDKSSETFILGKKLKNA